ncbi:MAG: hypothetical protein LRY67_00010 [Gammaproteobacteria bacterium]|nr:hypothetical protein [Gammaproteobacteria bacterium]
MMGMYMQTKWQEIVKIPRERNPENFQRLKISMPQELINWIASYLEDVQKTWLLAIFPHSAYIFQNDKVIPDYIKNSLNGFELNFGIRQPPGCELIENYLKKAVHNMNFAIFMLNELLEKLEFYGLSLRMAKENLNILIPKKQSRLSEYNQTIEDFNRAEETTIKFLSYLNSNEKVIGRWFTLKSTPEYMKNKKISIVNNATHILNEATLFKKRYLGNPITQPSSTPCVIS